jgi:hypothetical protein
VPGEIHSILNTVAHNVGGPLLVVLFYWFRFHSLRETRSYTTAALYHLGVATFIVPFVLIYFLLPELSSLAAVWVLIAFWLTPILPEAWRSFCHGIAQIPTYAHSLQGALAVAPFELRPEDLPAIHRKVGRFGYHPDDFQAVQSTFIQSRFLKITAIMYHLEKWTEKKEPFMQRNAEHYSELRHNYDLLSFKAVRALRHTSAIYGAIMDDSKVEPDDWQALDLLTTQDNRLQSAARDAAGCMLEDLRKDMDFLLDNLFLFIARAALASEWSSGAYKRRLETIGFKIARPIPGITQTIISAVTVTLVWGLIWLIPVAAQGLDSKPAAIARVFILPSLNLTLNFLVVYYCKRKFAFANEVSLGRFPIGFILTVGIFSALLMFPFRAVFDYFQFPEQFMHVLVRGLPLSIFPWGTGAVTALLVQNSIWDAFKSEQMKRIMDGVTFGACFVLLILLLLSIHRIAPIPQMQQSLSPLWMIVSSFGFGFVIGYLVIARVREASSLHVFAHAARNGVLMRA